MVRTLALRKRGPSQFVEAIELEGSELTIKRHYSKWETVDKRLREIGLETTEILRLKSAFDSEADTALIRLPYRLGDEISTI